MPLEPRPWTSVPAAAVELEARSKRERESEALVGVVP